MNGQKKKETILTTASLESEISELKDENKFLKQLLSDNPTSLNVEKIIHITVRVGTGKGSDPVRDIHKLWTEDGKFIVTLENYPI